MTIVKKKLVKIKKKKKKSTATVVSDLQEFILGAGATVALSTLQLNGVNPRQIDDIAFEKLCNNIKNHPQFMQLRPIVVDADNIIIGGNQRYKACVHLGLKVIPADWIKQVSSMSDDEKKAFMLLDNVSAGTWDLECLTVNWDMESLKLVGLEDLQGLDQFLRDFKNEEPLKPNKWQEHYRGMPGYENVNQESMQRVIIHFNSEKSVKKFSKLIGQKITPKTKALWYPQEEIKHAVDKAYISEP